MDELAATMPSSPFGVTVLVDMLVLVPFSVFSCVGSVSVRNISLYSKLCRVSNRITATTQAFSVAKTVFGPVCNSTQQSFFMVVSSFVSRVDLDASAAQQVTGSNVP